MSDLIKDDKFHSATKIAEKLSKDIAKWEDSRAGTLATLRDIQKTIEESYHDRTIAKVSGASAAVAGSTMNGHHWLWVELRNVWCKPRPHHCGINCCSWWR